MAHELTGPREAVLGAIRAALADEPARTLPVPEPVFAPEPASTQASLLARFRDELAALAGETLIVSSAADIPAALNRLLGERALDSVAAQDCASVREALALVAPERVFLATGAARARLEAASCGVFEAAALLADTGSVIALFATPGERLLPYLPRTSIAVAHASALHAHMDDAALHALYSAARERQRGEGVIITGPSRSADVEKTLVLGAHGPAALIVIIAGGVGG